MEEKDEKKQSAAKNQANDKTRANDKSQTIEDLLVKENRRKDYYPDITYSPSGQLCAYKFDLQVQIFNPNAGFTPPKDDKYTNKDIANFRKITDKNTNNFIARFPKEELIKEHDQQSTISKFTGLNVHAVLIPKYQHPGVLIALNMNDYLSQLNLTIDHSYLQVSLLNGKTAPVGLLMTTYGLRALKTVYDSYKISSRDLPILDFEKDKLSAVVPIVHLDKDREYDLKVGKIEPKILRNTIEFEVPNSIKDPVYRSQLAFALLEKATGQAHHNLQKLRDERLR